MDLDASVKRLDFDDVSFTIPAGVVNAAMALSEASNDALQVSAAPPSSLLEISDNCSIGDLREEAERIRENLNIADTFVSYFSEPFQQKVNEEAQAQAHSVGQLKKWFSFLQAESMHLSVGDGVLRRLADWQAEDEKISDVVCLTDESEKMDEELAALRTANAEAILEIESLIKTIANDVHGLERDLSTASDRLIVFNSEADKLAEAEATLETTRSGQLSSQLIQSKNLEDAETTMRQLEETLRQNEKDYAEAEAAMESRIEQYNLEIEELQAQATQLDREEERMRMLIDVTARYLQPKKNMECSSGVSIVSVEDGNVVLCLTTSVLTMDDVEDAVEDCRNTAVWQHELYLKVNEITTEIEEAKLVPEDVRIDDIVSEAQKQSISSSFIEAVNDGDLSNFGPQLAYLVRELHQRLTIHRYKVASLSPDSGECSYLIDHTLGSSVITLTKPEKLLVSLEVPENWPMEGTVLNVKSVELLEGHSKSAAALDASKNAVELAQELPEYVRHDLLFLMRAVQKIVEI